MDLLDIANLPESTKEVLLEMTLPLANKRYSLLAFPPQTSEESIQDVRRFFSENNCRIDKSVSISSGKYCSLLDADEQILGAVPFLLRKFGGLSVKLIGKGKYSQEVKGTLRNTVIFPAADSSPHRYLQKSMTMSDSSEREEEKARILELNRVSQKTDSFAPRIGSEEVEIDISDSEIRGRDRTRDRKRETSRTREGDSGRDRQRDSSRARDDEESVSSHRDRRDRNRESSRGRDEGDRRDRQREPSRDRQREPSRDRDEEDSVSSHRDRR